MGTTTRRPRWSQAVGALVALLSILAACSGGNAGGSTTDLDGAVETSAATGEASEPKTLVIGIQADPNVLNPNLSTNGPVQQLGTMIYEPLVYFDNEAGGPKPLLARDWEISDDGLTYTFHLVDAEFTDGEELTSTDVKYTLEEVATEYFAPFAAAAENIESIDDSDPKTVVIKLKQPFGPFLLSLTRVEILPEHVFAGTDVLTNPASTTEPVGTGPFTLASYTPGVEWVLERNDGYWQEGYPLLDRIIARVVSDSQAAVLALQTGTIQYISSQVIAVPDAISLGEMDHLQLVPDSFAPNATYLMFNVNREPVNDKRVRQALFQAVDRKYLHEFVFDGTGNIATAPFDSRLEWATHPDIDFDEMYPYDPEAAAAALDAAGYPVGPDGKRFTLTFLVEAATRFQQVAEAVAEMFRAIDVEVKIDAPEYSVTTERAFTPPGDFDVFIISYTSNGDPALGIERIYVTGSIGTTLGNASGYSNPEVDRLFEEGRYLTSPEERAVPYRAVQEILAEDLPSIPLIETKLLDVASTNVEGLWYAANWGQWHRADVTE